MRTEYPVGFVLSEKAELTAVLAVEEALSGGALDRHLGWVESIDSPSAHLSDAQYGYQLGRFTHGSLALGQPRPAREPIDFQQVATGALGLDYDTPFTDLAQWVSTVDDGWYDFLAEAEGLDPKEIKALKKMVSVAYMMNSNTEDDLPGFDSTLEGAVRKYQRRLKIELPGSYAWVRAWSGEEAGHKHSMGVYGAITDLLNSKEHAASRNSQLRALFYEFPNIFVAKIFPLVQELATNYAHKNTAALQGPIGNELGNKVAGQEAGHHNVNLDESEAILEALPNEFIQVFRYIMLSPRDRKNPNAPLQIIFEMPGSVGIPNYRMKAARIVLSGIFTGEHVHDAIRSSLQKLGLLRRTEETKEYIAYPGLSPAATQALDDLREVFGEKAIHKNRTGPVVLGQTIRVVDLARHRRKYAGSWGLPAKLSTRINRGEVTEAA